jgi:hypothetical protein
VHTTSALEAASRGVADDWAPFAIRLSLRWRAIPDRDGESLAHQVRRHAAAHESESNECHAHDQAAPVEGAA